MSQLMPFTYDGSPVRVLDVDGEPAFVASDVCDYFAVSNRNRTLQQLDADEKGGTQIDTPGGRQTVAYLTEAGLYHLLFILQPSKARGVSDEYIAEREEQLKAFKRWVTHEVLPSIRRTGGYGSIDSLTRRDLAMMIVEAEDAREIAEQRARELAPAARAWSTMVACTGDYSVDEAAKALTRDPAITTGRNRLFASLSELGWVYRSGRRNSWHAYQAQVECGRLVMKLGTPFLNHRTGEFVLPAPTIRITSKGLSALHRLLGGTDDLSQLIGAEPKAVAS